MSGETSAMIFIHNKYTRIYYSIISNAQSRLLPKDVYTEKHHIIPKSLGGDNHVSNLVRLTAKEHFICHLFLTKMTTGRQKRKMAHAAWLMANVSGKGQTRYKTTSKIYELLRKAKSYAMSQITGELHHSYGIKRSDKTRKLQSLIRKGKTYEELYDKDTAIKLKQLRSEQKRAETGEKNLMSKHWILISPNGIRYEFIGGLVGFCSKHNLRYNTIAGIANGIFPVRGKYKDWIVIKSAA
jgi:hypothetical protein